MNPVGNINIYILDIPSRADGRGMKPSTLRSEQRDKNENQRVDNQTNWKKLFDRAVRSIDISLRDSEKSSQRREYTYHNKVKQALPQTK